MTEFGGVPFSTEDAVLDSRRTDRSGSLVEGRPEAVLLPRDAADVAKALRWATSTGTPIVPRGAGTSLTGASTAGTGTVVLDLSGMNRIVSLSAADATAVVEPGVITADLDRAAATAGLRYAPDPASHEISTIGGNIATNAGGLRCAKYGVTRDSVLGLSVILADGTRIETGTRTFKGVAGYDLTGLFVGSEGTLGVVVAATVRLRPIPAGLTTIAASFTDAAAACTALAGVPGQPVIAELLDAAALSAVDAYLGTSLAARGSALLIVQVSSGVDGVLSALRPTAVSLEVSSDGDALLHARRSALPAIEQLGRPLIEDIAVPRSRLPEAITAIADIAARWQIPICTLAHAADGNLHPIIVDDPSRPAAAASAADEIFALALKLGGTITGEHGIGTLKREWLTRELDPANLTLQRGLKSLFDPNGILNPGKVL
ncbi:FAD-binding oxidoreductase [Winogradskya humida]|uniref:FAD-linked oxidase n=1 Tax=Winogradskya humida TaxID=113566 RepID=A0ABQ3ZI43_9ACTN|nr:FAD-linked oxidase C-terminal domain-containing protein [Actinoplanes humidus]GIE18223.1 FAD-linked oxidase [Actinoplanes humidus]